MSSQNIYTEFLNEYISPALRKRNFSGSAGIYQMPNDKAYILIGFQKSKWSTKQNVEFTVNVSVISKEVWDIASKQKSWTEETPSAIEQMDNKTILDNIVSNGFKGLLIYLRF